MSQDLTHCACAWTRAATPAGGRCGHHQPRPLSSGGGRRAGKGRAALKGEWRRQRTRTSVARACTGGNSSPCHSHTDVSLFPSSPPPLQPSLKIDGKRTLRSGVTTTAMLWNTPLFHLSEVPMYGWCHYSGMWDAVAVWCPWPRQLHIPPEPEVGARGGGRRHPATWAQGCHRPEKHLTVPPPPPQAGCLFLGRILRAAVL